jgi:beta-phosphoglucomutase
MAKKMHFKGIIFDLDGVIVSTDEYHYQAWKEVSDEYGIYFDYEINERLRGVSRMESVDIIMEKAERHYTEKEKTDFATRKNNVYRRLLSGLSSRDILPGVESALDLLAQRGVLLAIGSSSKNTPVILERIGLAERFQAISDGNHISKSKPDPEVFLLAANRLKLAPEDCLVVEDAVAGVTAALRAGMAVLAVGSASQDKRATFRALDLSFSDLIKFF